MINFIGCTKISERTNFPKIDSAETVYEELKDFCNKRQEHFMVIYLDSANCIIESRVISIGTLNSAIVHPRDVFAPGLINNSGSIIIAHNHPSGELVPSIEDKNITRRLVDAGKILGINVLDHLIISSKGFLSFKSEDLMPETNSY